MPRTHNDSNVLAGIVTAVALSMTAAGTALADAEVSHVASFAVGGTPTAATAEIPPFDTRGGTRVLQSVLFKVDTHYSADVSFENTMDQAVAAWQVELGGRLAFSTTGASSEHVFNRTLARGERLAASDGIGGEGRDYVELGTLAADVVLNGAATSVEPFLRDTPIEVRIETDPAIGVFPTAALLDTRIDNADVKGTVMVIYGYSNVAGPKPTR